MRGFAQAGDSEPLREVCHAHSRVCVPEGAVPVRQQGDLNGMVAMLQQKTRALETEIERRVEAENALRRQVAQLAEADRRKDEFLAMLGHELRNPMAPIVNALELMRLGASDATRTARAREVIERQVKLMRRLVDDLLDVARVTSGAIELQKEKVLLINLVERALESASAIVDERGHRLVLDIPDEQIVLHGDGARLGQVLANLIHNAAKYTDVGGHILVGARREGEDLVISVRDNGMGMDPELRERVFDMFVQGPDSLARSRGGLGIGLTLVRRILQLHDGSIEARSAGLGKGSEFVARIPIRDETPSAFRGAAANPALVPGL
jgi:signal transduction histidine kinase